MKRARKLGYLFREGVRNLYTHGFMSFAAVCVTVACLVIIGSFSTILYNLNLMVHTLERENRIMAYVDEDYTTGEAKSVGSRINLIDNVREAVFVSREEAGERFIQQQGGGEAYEGIDASTFRDRFVITLEDNSRMDETVKAIQQVQGVADVSAKTELANGFTTLQNVLNIASAAIMALVMYLMVKVMLDHAALSIALFKIFGYRKRELNTLFLNGSTLLITAGVLVSIPLSKRIMDALYPYLVSNVPCAMDLRFDWWIYAALFVGCMLIYALIYACLTRTIHRVKPGEVLKNRE